LNTKLRKTWLNS